MHQFLERLLHISIYSLPAEALSESPLNHLVARSDGRGVRQLPVLEAPSQCLSSIFSLLNCTNHETKRGEAEERGGGGGGGEMSARGCQGSALPLSDPRATT